MELLGLIQLDVQITHVHNMTKINNIDIHFDTVLVELGFNNQLSNVDTINKIITISTKPKTDYIPKVTTSEISLQTEKQVAQTVKV